MSEIISNNPLLFLALGVFVSAALLGSLVSALAERHEPDPKPGEQPTTITHSHAVAIGPSVNWAQLRVDGREVFFPPPAHPNPLYEVSFAGVVRDRHGRLADALYLADDDGNFSKRFDWIRVNGRNLSNINYELIACDRFAHRYIIHFFDFTNARLTFTLDRHARYFSSGSLTVQVTVLPRGTLMEREQREAETIDREQESARRSRELMARQERMASAERFASQIKALCVRAETIPNFGNPEYLAKFARAYGEELIKTQAEIRAEATELLEQHEIVAFLQRHHPGVVDRFLGRLRALHLAEQLVVEKHVAALAAPKKEKSKPKRKLSADEVRELKVRRQRLLLGDKLALAKDRAATIEDTKAYVKAQYGHLDEDEQQQIVQQLLEEIREENDNNGKTL